MIVNIIYSTFRPKAPVFKFDHSYPGSEKSPLLVILYAELGEKSFAQFHQRLQPMAEQNKIQYVFRHRYTVGFEFIQYLT